MGTKTPAAALSLIVAAISAFSLTFLPNAASAAQPAVATGNVNLRAGPGTIYPIIGTVPAGAPIITHGCLTDHRWCDASWGDQRGWLSASYIQVVYAGRPVVLTPDLIRTLRIGTVAFNRAYWHAHYAGRPWIGRWNYYYRPVPHARSRSVTHECADGSCTRSVVRTGPYGGRITHERTISR